MQKTSSKNHPYLFLIFLLVSLLLGSLTGALLGPRAVALKPLGDIFLNLMFTVVIPLVFFSIASAIANMGELRRIWRVMSSMFASFLFTSAIAAIFMLVIVKLFPPAQGIVLKLSFPVTPQAISIGEQIANIFTVADFYKLFSRENILALIFFAGLVGLATAHLGEKAGLIKQFLQAGTNVSMKMVSYIMYYAPIGFFAYFAVLVAELGPQLLQTYFRASLIYYLAALVYFIVALSFYAFLAARTQGIKVFWKNSALPIMTSLATCSGAASIPANLQACKQMQIPAEVYETVVPLGAVVHKDGSVLGGMVKIAFLFGIFHLNFSGFYVLGSTFLVAILVGTVIGAIPSGGMIAEMRILSLYGLPPQALMIIAAITLLIDPPAPLLNVMGNTVCSMLTARLVEGRDWLKKRL